MTGAQLQALRDLCDAATPGPWKANEGSDNIVAPSKRGDHWRDVAHVTRVHSTERRGTGESLANARLIAAAREAIPALIAEVERLQERQVAA